VKEEKNKAVIFRIVHSGCVRYVIRIGQIELHSYISVANLARQFKKRKPSYQKGEVSFMGLTPAQEAEFWFLYKN